MKLQNVLTQNITGNLSSAKFVFKQGIENHFYQRIRFQYFCFLQCCGSVTFGTDPDPGIRASDQWIRIRIRILLFSSLTFKTPTKNYFISKFFCLLPFEGTFTLFLQVTKQNESRFFLLFLLVDRRIQIRSQSQIRTSD
jgi:hypothetical protein